MNNTDELKPSDVLDHAATLIDYWGWCRSDYIGSKGAMCHVGAIEAAAGYTTHYQYPDGTWDLEWVDDESARALVRAATAYDVKAIGEMWIVGWNDTTCKSKEEAVAKLREAAELARGEGR